MDSIDYFYFRSLDEIRKPFYDWERQVINVGCSSQDIGIDDEQVNLTIKGKENIAKLIHEYIHFLQNFATNWGGPIFVDLAVSLLKIGASSNESEEILKLPLNKENINNDLLISGLELRESVIERINRSSRSFTHDKSRDAISVSGPTDGEFVITNGLTSIDVGLKLIREHMAYLGTQLYLNHNDDEIHSRNLVTFKRNEHMLARNPEYWILFEYFYASKCFENVGRGVFFLTQYSLAGLAPNYSIIRFIKWIHDIDLLAQRIRPLIDYVQEWTNLHSEKSENKKANDKAIAHCESIIKLSKKYESENHLFEFTRIVTEYTLANILKSEGGMNLFCIEDNFSDLTYWKKKIDEFGTGIVLYTDGVFAHGLSAENPDLLESFKHFLAGNLIVKKLLTNQISTCPFLYDIPICQAEYRDSQNCVKNPFLMLDEKSVDACLFVNGVLMLGLSKRLELYNSPS
ncbi:hypothetical protein [Dyadobacter aurulentus]|uniref:hypothetical protein n=1 Tax=Dyadobacter sp. UC 10 TaxID=2605428 RepID=UPI0011F3509C|nr:hypothetical protein [Dyadobacter sp. UC 10]KAA0992459.1 hypothetical protein FXO21_20920 [Dyadobacter sp. UC 10]